MECCRLTRSSIHRPEQTDSPGLLSTEATWMLMIAICSPWVWGTPPASILINSVTIISSLIYRVQKTSERSQSTLSSMLSPVVVIVTVAVVPVAVRWVVIPMSENKRGSQLNLFISAYPSMHCLESRKAYTQLSE